VQRLDAVAVPVHLLSNASGRHHRAAPAATAVEDALEFLIERVPVLELLGAPGER
jgi:hypothetical protein